MRLTTDQLPDQIGLLIDGSPVDASDVRFVIETDDAEVAIESLLGIVNVLRKLSGKEAVTVKGAGQVRRRKPKSTNTDIPAVSFVNDQGGQFPQDTDQLRLTAGRDLDEVRRTVTSP